MSEHDAQHSNQDAAHQEASQKDSPGGTFAAPPGEVPGGRNLLAMQARHSAADPLRAQAIRNISQRYGNQYVQRLIERLSYADAETSGPHLTAHSLVGKHQQASVVQRLPVEGYDSPADWATHLDSLGADELLAERRRRWNYHLKGLVERTLDFDTLQHHTRMREALENAVRPWAAQIEAVHGDNEARLGVVRGTATGIANFLIGKIPVIGPVLSIGFGVAVEAFTQATPTIGGLPDAALNAFTERPTEEQNEEERRVLARLEEVAIEQLPNTTFADLYYNDTRENQRLVFGIQESSREDFEREFSESTEIRRWVAEKAAAILQPYQQNVLISEGFVPQRGESFPTGSASGIWKLRATSSEWVAEIESAYSDMSADQLFTEVDESPVPNRFPLSGGFQDAWDVVHGKYRGDDLVAGAASEPSGFRMSAPRRLATDHPIGAIIRTGGLGAQTPVTDEGDILEILRIIEPDLASVPNVAKASAALAREFPGASFNTTPLDMMREGAVVFIDLSRFDTGSSSGRSPLGFEVTLNLRPITNLSSDQMRRLRRLVPETPPMEGLISLPPLRE